MSTTKTTMIRPLDMSGFRVMNAGAPVASTDTATKGYVDQKSGSVFSYGQKFVGDGTTTEFELAYRTDDFHVFVFVGGIFQHISFIDEKTGESVIGNFQLFPNVNAEGKTVSTIQFSEPIPNGTNVVVMYTEVAL
jgi:hypothetical protein